MGKQQRRITRDEQEQPQGAPVVPEAALKPAEAVVPPVPENGAIKTSLSVPRGMSGIETKSATLKSPMIVGIRRTSHMLIFAAGSKVQKVSINPTDEITCEVRVVHKPVAAKMVEKPEENKMVEKPEETK